MQNTTIFELNLTMNKNPFLEDNPIDVIILTQNESLTNTEENTSHTFTKSYNVDRQYSTKIYRSRANEKLIYSLSNSEMKLTFYIIIHLSKKADSIELLPKKIEKLTGMRQSTFEKARSELVKKGIIKKQQGRARMYWINPHFLFAGNRGKFYKSNTNVKSKIKIN